MKFRWIFLTVLAAVSFMATVNVQAGEALDDLLNYPVIDQKCPSYQFKEEGMGLTGQGKAKFIALSKEQPLGQSFTLGPTAVNLWSMKVGLCHWPTSWQEGEEVTFTVWDSPKKTTKLYSRTLDWAHKWFKWDVAFDCHIPAKANTEYYFELTHNGGADNTINVAYIEGDDYTRGRPYVAGEQKDGFDLYFVAICKSKGNREANLKRLISKFDLNHPSLAEAKWAYYKGDLDTAVDLILRGFEKRFISGDESPKPNIRKIDTTRMDKVCDESRLYNDEKGKQAEWIEMSDQTTWREVWPGTSEYPRMNDLFWYLGQAYQATGNEKYSKKLNELMADYIQDNASPFEGGMRGGRWVAMFQAWRLGDAWDGFKLAVKSKGLTDDVKLAWMDYWTRMAKFAELEHSGGNHANAVGQALMEFGLRFPEFREAQHWKQWGFDKLVSNSLDLFYEDGACKEPTMNYHGYSLSNLLLGLDSAKKNGLEISEEITKLTEKALAYTAYMLKPNGTVPSSGDTNCEDFRSERNTWDGWRNGEAMKGATMYGRKDLLYIATAGKQGTRPAFTSYNFPDIRHFIMRSDWGGENGKDFEQARYMYFRGGSFGSHGHWDMNQVTLYAYGRPLIIDPGRTTYGTPLMYELTENRSHNVLLVDDQKMNRVGPTLHSWNALPAIDLVDNEYKNLYNGIDHRRAVVFVRPDYYVVFDHTDGQSAHNAGINFWLTPPDVTIDKTNCSVNSNDPNGSNVLVKVIDSDGVEIADRKGTIDLGGERSDIPVVTFWKKSVNKADFATVLYPYEKGQSAPVIKTDLAVSGDSRVCRIETPAGVDFVFYSPNAGKAETSGNTVIEGRTGLVRTDKQGQIISIGLIDGTAVTLSGKTVVNSQQLVSELSVVYLPDRVEVTCPKGEASLQIASMGRTKAVVNGKETTINGDMFKAF